MQNLFRRNHLIIIILLIILIITTFMVLLLKQVAQKSPTEKEPIVIFEKGAKPSPAPKIIPPIIQAAPTYAPGKGLGIDTESSAIQSSIAEIKKINSILPYIKSVTLSTGLTVSIVIPISKYQNNPWTLTVNISPINFQSSESEKDYELNKKSFLEAVKIVFSVLQASGADPAKIYFSWGNKAYIQDQAERWLKE